MMHSAGATKAQMAPLVMDSQQLWMEAKREVTPLFLCPEQLPSQYLFPLRGLSEQPE